MNQKKPTFSDLKRIEDYLFEIPKNFRSDMKVPARIYADKNLLEVIVGDRSLEQLVNVSVLPGIIKYSLAMPDIHEGYGFPIGGVAANLFPEGMISPGGVGYDINCGVRILTSNVSFDEIEPVLPDLVNQIQKDIPSGLGSRGEIRLDFAELDKVLKDGVFWAVKKGYATKEDQDHTEENGCLKGANPDLVSKKAKERGLSQLGTLGSGNHFLEIQRVEEVFDKETAEVFGLYPNQITVMIHTGSRGLGHQVCTDYVRIFYGALGKYGIKLPDIELACAPLSSKEGEEYFSAMSAAANFAWTNRQLILYLVREVWKRVLEKKISKNKLDLHLIYDVAHNIAKLEDYEVGGRANKLCVHRKGATRAFGPRRKEMPKVYQETGQPVIIPGSMGTSSYILAGTDKAMIETFGSVCHGAGRALSRAAAKKKVWGADLRRELEKKGILIRCRRDADLAEEAPIAYKDIDNVVEVVVKAGLARKVAQVKPLGVVKG